MKKNILLMLLCFLTILGKAYSYGDNNFRYWTLKSTDIVLTDNIYWTGGEPINDYSYSNSFAKANIIEVIKGNLTTDHVINALYRNCEPIAIDAEYESQVKCICFIQKEGDQSYLIGYFKGVSNADISFIREKILELQNLYLIDNDSIRFPKVVDWIISCSANSFTRSACYDLEEYSSFVNFYENLGVVTNTTVTLSTSQKATLKTNIFNYQLGWEDMYIIDLFYLDYKEETEKFLLDMLKKLPDNQLYFADYVMERLNNIKPKAALKKIVEEMGEDKYEDKRQRKLVNDFLKIYTKK